jgi:hypothetical protein
MKKKNLPIIIIGFLVLFQFNTFAQQISLGNIENVAPGAEVLVPVNFTGLSDVGAITLFITFDDNVVSFVELTNPIPDLIFTLANVLPDPPPTIAISWFDFTGQGIPIPDGTGFELKFNFIDGQTDLEFLVENNEIVNGAGNILSVTYSNGSITGNLGFDQSVWNGTGNWSEGANWSQGVPGSETEAVIASGTVNIFSGASCKSLTINPDAELIIQPNFFLFVVEDVTVDGTFTILSDETGTGSFIPSGLVMVNGTMNVNRYLSGDGMTSHFVSTPTDPVDASVFNNQEVKQYNENTQQWEILQVSDPLQVGFGYEVTNGNNNTVVFSGDVQVESVSLSGLSYTENGTDLPDGLNLAGNPFTTAILWDQGDWDKTNLHQAIYTWKNNNFVCWNGSLGALKNGIIPAMQGFFVVADGPGASMTIPKNARVQNNQPYYKDTESVDNMVSIRIIDEQENEDWTYMRFNNSASKKFDPQYDAYKLYGSQNAPQLYSFSSNGVELSINEFPKPLEEIDTSFVLGFMAPSQGTYKLVRDEFTIFGQPILLADFEDKVVTDLKVDSVYTFTSGAGTFTERFKIYFKEWTGIDSYLEQHVTVYGYDQNLIIQSDIALKNPVIQVFNLNGKLLYTSDLESGAHFIKHPVPNTVRGLVVVRLLSSDGALSKKIFLN